MGTVSYDAVVVGLGAMGSAAAYHLSKRGRKVLGLDRFRPPHQQGSSHGRSRAIRKAYFENPAYVPLLHRAYLAWEQLERETGRELLKTTGTLMLGRPESPVVAGSLRSAREYDLDHELLDSRELRRRFPPLIPDADTVGFLEPSGGVLFPEACIEAHLERARALGADLRFGETVLSWQELPEQGGVEVVTSRGRLCADRLVLAPGAWSPELLPAAAGSLSVSRQVQFWIRPTKQEAHFRAESLPIWVWEPAEGDIFYGFPALDGSSRPERSRRNPGAGAKFGIHTPGELVSAESVERDVRSRDFERLRECLEGRVRWLEPRPTRSCVCLYTNTPDGHFILGPHPRFPSVVLAAGFSGHGFKFAGLVGGIVADLVIEGRSEHPIDLFDPRRAGLRLQEIT